MHAEFTIVNARDAQIERPELMVKNPSEMDVAVRQFFRPYVLTFVALAITFGSWSYGYVLSRYLHHSEVSRASLTRAWVDHRNDSIATVSHEQVRPRLLAVALFTVAALRVAHRSPNLVLDEPAPVREAFLFSSLIPFRAPPSNNPSLA